MNKPSIKTRFIRRSAYHFLGCLLSCGLVFGAFSVSVADDESDHQTRANELRQASQARAAAKLGYSEIYNPNENNNRHVDYFTLSRTIQRLAIIVEELERSSRQTDQRLAHTIPSFPQRPMMPNELLHVYGPNGPDERSVTLLLEYQLLVGGNPRLKIGKVVDHGESISATVITIGGSLVEEYRVNKQRGNWQPVRPTQIK